MKDTKSTGEVNQLLESIVLKVVSAASILKALKKGEIDIAAVPVDQYLNAKEIANIELTCKS